jgi:hypothetical protein
MVLVRAGSPHYARLALALIVHNAVAEDHAHDRCRKGATR